MNSHDIRQKFVDYFVRNNHVLMSSSPLIPLNDRSLLFVNAGMVPFKEVFLESEVSTERRVCTIQKCMRVSGKHNDLEQVGSSPRHHTFFEMLGNFSFGDYFKCEAIRYAWEILTQEFQLPVERLWVSVYVDDDEAIQLWEEVGVAKSRILRFGDKENFWSMGDTGPCGPSSEIHYYQGADPTLQKPEGVNSDDDDYVEIWNLVFMQYDRDAHGKLTPLSKPSIDTGMGMERLTSILQGVKNDYETDLFQPIIQSIMALTGGDDSHYREHYVAYNAIADHSRAIAFLMVDGVKPGNGGRDYVLRRIIRRASYFGKTLGLEQPFLIDILPSVIDAMGGWYPELHSKREDILSWTIAEEKRFQRTLTSGLHHLEEVIDVMLEHGDTLLSGQEAFKLHDTYGFPLDLTQKILADRGLGVDVQGYEDARRKQQQRSRAAAQLK